MNGIVERAKRFGVHGCNLHQMFDRIEALEQQVQAALEAAHHEAEKVVALRTNNTELREAVIRECIEYTRARPGRRGVDILEGMLRGEVACAKKGKPAEDHTWRATEKELP